MDVEILSRLQFAGTIMFHDLLPRVRLPRSAGLRLGSRRAEDALLLEPDGLPRVVLQRGVDRRRQQLAADAGSGYHLVPTNLDGVVGQRAEITDYGAMVFNPSSVDRLSHTLIGAFIMVGLLVHRFFRGKVKLDRSSC